MPAPQHHSVRMAFAVLKSFQASNEWVSCDELSRRSRYPETSTDRVIRILEELGAVIRDTRGRCRLHPHFRFLPDQAMLVAQDTAGGDNVVDLALIRRRRCATS